MHFFKVKENVYEVQLMVSDHGRPRFAISQGNVFKSREVSIGWDTTK